MNSNDFNKVVKKELDFCEELLCSKGKEYADDSDRLIAFKKAAGIQSISPKQALIGMYAKHVVSVFDMALSQEKYPLDRWVEKITDSINYMLLLLAMVVEEADE